MAEGQVVILSSLAARANARKLIDAAPHGAVVRIKAARRTLEQNDKMHAMISDLCRAKPEGRNLDPDAWKGLLMHMAGHKVRFEPALDGDGVVALGFRSSRLTKQQMSDLIECIAEYGARHGVAFQD